MSMQEALAAAKAAYDIEAQCIEEMKAYFDDEQFAKAVELLAKAPRIGAAGSGHSGIICQHFAHLMCCIERPARFVSPAEAVHGATGFIQEGDVMVFASRGDKTKELLPIVDICKAKKVKIITVTENLESPLATAADVVIKQHVNRMPRALPLPPHCACCSTHCRPPSLSTPATVQSSLPSFTPAAPWASA